MTVRLQPIHVSSPSVYYSDKGDPEDNKDLSAVWPYSDTNCDSQQSCLISTCTQVEVLRQSVVWYLGEVKFLSAGLWISQGQWSHRLLHGPSWSHSHHSLLNWTGKQNEEMDTMWHAGGKHCHTYCRFTKEGFRAWLLVYCSSSLQLFQQCL